MAVNISVKCWTNALRTLIVLNRTRIASCGICTVNESDERWLDLSENKVVLAFLLQNIQPDLLVKYLKLNFCGDIHRHFGFGNSTVL